MSQQIKPIAIVCSDIHLSHRPPIARSAEPNWYAAMRRPLNEVFRLAAKYSVPVLCCGDIFDRYNPPPELINFALANLPDKMICIPGQHDLYMHSTEPSQVEKTAYSVLVATGKIIDWSNKLLEPCGYFTLSGFQWGSRLQTVRTFDPVQIAIAHRFVYKSGEQPSFAHKDQSSKRTLLKLTGHDLCFFGDNHKPFITQRQGSFLVNCGSLMHRHSDEARLQRYAWVVYSDKSVEEYKLDHSKDVYLEKEKLPKALSELAEIDASEFVQELASLATGATRVIEIVKQYANDQKVGTVARKIIQRIMHEAQDQEDANARGRRRPRP